MENRRDGFARYLKGLAPYAGERPGAALVMNANPFTLGHAALVERAARESERVVLFVLSEDRSLVPYKDRLAMVKTACAKYDNVSVVSSGSYMISSATFPSYFLKDADIVTRTHAELDATLFTRIAAALNLTRRYVGEEPFSHTTSLYNEALAEVLPKAGVELVVIPRAQAQGEAISASHVRQLIHDGHIEEIQPLVPETTYAYLSGSAGQNAVKRIICGLNPLDGVLPRVDCLQNQPRGFRHAHQKLSLSFPFAACAHRNRRRRGFSLLSLCAGLFL